LKGYHVALLRGISGLLWGVDTSFFSLLSLSSSTSCLFFGKRGRFHVLFGGICYVVRLGLRDSFIGSHIVAIIIHSSPSNQASVGKRADLNSVRPDTRPIGRYTGRVSGWESCDPLRVGFGSVGLRCRGNAGRAEDLPGRSGRSLLVQDPAKRRSIGG
jgi:hypothetical protein